MYSSLNTEQNQAVHHIKGPLLILAGAGTGKTRVITCRIAHLIKNNISPNKILAVTFTNKAAGEMRERAAKLIGPAINNKMPTVSTFHSLGLSILKKHIKNLGYRNNFSLYDDKESLSIIQGILKDELNDVPLGYTPKEIQQFMGFYRLNYKKNTAYKSPLGNRVASFIFREYQERLKNCNAIDFDDLIDLPIKLLKNESIADRIRSLYDFILVDEFQDTNAQQFELIQLLCKTHNNLCVVGDDDQSIYGFRGSDRQFMLKFDKYFPGTKIIKLEQNYRSTPVILNTANQIITNNQARFDKKLWSNGPKGDLIQIIKSKNDQEEAEKVIENIGQYRYQKKFSWNDIAILYRTNPQSRILEQELITKNIPYTIIGGTKFFDRKEVRDILAYVKWFQNPQEEQSFFRIINTPPRGIGQQTLKSINSLCHQEKLNVFEILNSPLIEKNFSQSIASSLKHLLSLQKKYQKSFQTSGCSRILKTLIDDIQYDIELKRQYKKEEIISDKKENINGLIYSAQEFEKENGYNQSFMRDFIEKMTLFTDDGLKKNKDKKLREAGIKLMTLHNSKGLEFPFVSLVGLNEGVFPHERSLLEDHAIEEERRLFYVGVTRAQKKLIISYFDSRTIYGQEKRLKPSRFLKEIPSNCLEDLSLPMERGEAKNLFASLKDQF